MSKQKDGGSAFPILNGFMKIDDCGKQYQRASYCDIGMSRRDYFAAQALIGLCASSQLEYMRDFNEVKKYSQIYAEASYTLADAMIAEGEKQNVV